MGVYIHDAGTCKDSGIDILELELPTAVSRSVLFLGTQFRFYGGAVSSLTQCAISTASRAWLSINYPISFI